MDSGLKGNARVGWQWGITPQRGDAFSDPASQGPLSVLRIPEGPAAVLAPILSSVPDCPGQAGEFVLTFIPSAPHLIFPGPGTDLLIHSFTCMLRNIP